MKVFKTVTVLAAILMLGACSRTTELAPGTIGDATPEVYGRAAPRLPANWQKLSNPAGSDAGLAYGCRPEECANPGLIGYRALRVGGNHEEAGAVIPVSPRLLRRMETEVARASGGTVGNVRVSRVSKAGDEVEQTMTIAKARKAYAIIRMVRLPNEVRAIFAAGMTPADARAYMDIALAGI